MKRKMMQNNAFKTLLILFITFTFKNGLAQETDRIQSKTAVIQALNKIRAKSSILNLKIGEKITFGQLSITAHKCWKAPLDQTPESKLLLEVLETKEDIESRIFYGWIFASSPSISGLEHPIYDLTALDCVTNQ